MQYIYILERGCWWAIRRNSLFNEKESPSATHLSIYLSIYISLSLSLSLYIYIYKHIRWLCKMTEVRVLYLMGAVIQFYSVNTLSMHWALQSCFVAIGKVLDRQSSEAKCAWKNCFEHGRVYRALTYVIRNRTRPRSSQWATYPTNDNPTRDTKENLTYTIE